MSTEASLLVWDVSLSNLSGAAWFINRTEGNLVDPWAMLAEIRAWKIRQPIPTWALLLDEREHPRKLMDDMGRAERADVSTFIDWTTAPGADDPMRTFTFAGG